jgi:hypothetical protein
MIDQERARRVHEAAANGANGNSTPSATEPVKPKWRRSRELVDLILARASEPWVDLQLDDEKIVSVRLGGILLLIGGTGRGKTSLVVCLLLEHAMRQGPAILMSLELTGDEGVARAIGSRCNASWASVLRGELTSGQMIQALPERAVIIERDIAADNPVAVLSQAIDELRAEYPNEPILIAVDYVQLVGADAEEDIRPRVGKVMRMLDRIARDKRVVILALSQGSRASARALSSGDAIGAATTDSGAESSDLERWASVTLAIGQHGEEQPDGSCLADLSIGKSRMGGGDRVLPARYLGRSGRWELVGEAWPAAQVRDEREVARKTKGVQAKALAVEALLGKSKTPVSRRDIRAAIGGTDAIIREAVRSLLDDAASGVIEVEPPKNNAYRVWLRSLAEAEGMAIREVAA